MDDGTGIQRRLPASVFVPFGVVLALSVSLLFVRPAGVGIGAAAS